VSGLDDVGVTLATDRATGGSTFRPGVVGLTQACPAWFWPVDLTGGKVGQGCDRILPKDHGSP